jgi:hypothetical protein
MQGSFFAGKFNIHLVGSAEDFADLGIALDSYHGLGKEEAEEVPSARGRLEVLAVQHRRGAIRQERGMQEVRRSEGQCSAGALHILQRFGIDWRVTRTTSPEPPGSAAYAQGEGSRPLARPLAVGGASNRRAAGQPCTKQPIACRAQVGGQAGESSIAQSHLRRAPERKNPIKQKNVHWKYRFSADVSSQ